MYFALGYARYPMVIILRCYPLRPNILFMVFQVTYTEALTYSKKNENVLNICSTVLSNLLTGQFYGLTLEYTPITNRLQHATVKVKTFDRFML